jgi:hypothetical protein
MNADKNPTVLSDACAALGIPAGTEPRVNMARLMNLPQLQPVNTATAKKPIEAEPTQDKVLCQKTFVENESKRIMSCQSAAGVKPNEKQTLAEATRRWERTKKKTLLDDDMAIANDQINVGNMVQEIQHNGWKLVLKDDTNHYYRFPVKPGATGASVASSAVSAPVADDAQQGVVAETAIVPAKPSDDAGKVMDEKEVDAAKMAALVAENAELEQQLAVMRAVMRAYMLDHPTDDEEDRPSTSSLKRKVSEVAHTDTDAQTA